MTNNQQIIGMIGVWQAGPNVHRRPLPGEIARICAGIVNADRERQLLLTSRRRELPVELAALWADDPPGAREAAIAAQQEKYRLADEWRAQQAAAVAGKVTPAPVEKPKRPTPQHILDRDAVRAEAQRQSLGLDRLDKAADRFVEAELQQVKRVPLDDDEQLSPDQKEAIRRKQFYDAAE